MTDEWDEYAAAWDEDPRVHDYAANAFASLIELADVRDGWHDRRVLDFGCGTGLMAKRIAPHVHEVVAIDRSPGMIAALAAKSLPGVTGQAGDIGDADVRAAAGWDAGFDLVVASSVCAFLDDYPGAAAQLAAALRPGGMLVQWDWLGTQDGGFGLTEARIAEVLEGAGLLDVAIARPFAIGEGEETMQVVMGSGRKA